MASNPSFESASKLAASSGGLGFLLAQPQPQPRGAARGRRGWEASGQVHGQGESGTSRHLADSTWGMLLRPFPFIL